MATPFLTSYDPSDLPGGSIDPLGFDRGYLFLADQILPGLTNAAGRPRYFSMMCAATHLAPGDGKSEREKLLLRSQCLLLLERFWAAANVLASNESLDESGIRGVTFARTYVDRVKDKRALDADFQMLASQSRYGAVGIYANVASNVRLLDRRAMLPTRDLGRTLAHAFLDETAMPSKLRVVIRNGAGEVSQTALIEWGKAAHIAGKPGKIEADCLGQAFEMDPARARLGALLKNVPGKPSEHELSRLRRVRQVAVLSADRHLAEAIDAIVAFEACYRVLILAFERVLWLCTSQWQPHSQGSSSRQNSPRLL